jgi:hypothetical protein
VVGTAARDPQGAALSDAATDPIFRRDGDLFVPSGHTRGPWDPRAQHGGAPAALLAEAVRDDGMHVARLAYEFLGPVPLEPLRVETRVARPGRRLRFVEAEMFAGDEPVMRARATLLRRAEVRLPDRPDAEAVPGGGPEHGVRSPFPTESEEPEGFHRTAMDIRFTGGTGYGPGPALAWFRFARPLVDADAPSAVALVAAAADFGNGVSRVLEFETHLFLNTDLSIHLHREPEGEWVLLESRTRVERHGSGLATSRLYDQRGPVGVAAQSLFVAER